MTPPHRPNEPPHNLRGAHGQGPWMAHAAAGPERGGMARKGLKNTASGKRKNVFGGVRAVRRCSQGFMEETGEPEYRATGDAIRRTPQETNT